MYGTATPIVSHDPDDWCGHQSADRWEARVLIDDLEVSFGSVNVLATVEGDGNDWSLWSIEIPADESVVNRYWRTRHWVREEWEDVVIGGLHQSPTDRRITAAVRAWLATDGRAVDALCRAIGE